jgi:hypothetical protein
MATRSAFFLLVACIVAAATADAIGSRRVAIYTAIQPSAEKVLAYFDDAARLANNSGKPALNAV